MNYTPEQLTELKTLLGQDYESLSIEDQIKVVDFTNQQLTNLLTAMK